MDTAEMKIALFYQRFGAVTQHESFHEQSWETQIATKSDDTSHLTFCGTESRSRHEWKQASMSIHNTAKMIINIR